MLEPPCKGCTQRNPECHCSCKDYHDYQKRLREIKKQYAGLCMMLDYEDAKGRRLCKRKGK